MRAFRFRARAGAALLAVCALAEVGHAQQVVRLPAQDRALRGRPATVFSVGTEEGRDWEMFSSQVQVAFDATDNLYVLDRGNHRVVVLDRAGRFVRQFGRRGGGPGEFISPMQLAVTRAGEVVVSDVGRSAFTIFDTSGRYKRSVPFSAPTRGLVGLSMEPHPTAGVVTTLRPFGMSRDTARGRDGISQAQNAILWYPLAASAAPTVLFRAREAVVQSTESTRRGDSRGFARSRATVTFAPGFYWSVLPAGGVAAAVTARYQVQVVDARGRPVRTLARPINPRAVTRRDREEARARVRRQLSTGEGRVSTVGNVGRMSRAEVEARVEAMEFADIMPVIRGVTADPQGRLWIARAGDGAEGGPIDLVTTEGRYIGTLTGERLPRAVSASGRAAYVERDDLGVERVVVKTLPATWR